MGRPRPPAPEYTGDPSHSPHSTRTVPPRTAPRSGTPLWKVIGAVLLVLTVGLAAKAPELVLPHRAGPGYLQLRRRAHPRRRRAVRRCLRQQAAADLLRPCRRARARAGAAALEPVVRTRRPLSALRLRRAPARRPALDGGHARRPLRRRPPRHGQPRRRAHRHPSGSRVPEPEPAQQGGQYTGEAATPAHDAQLLGRAAGARPPTSHLARARRRVRRPGLPVQTDRHLDRRSRCSHGRSGSASRAARRQSEQRGLAWAGSCRSSW